MTRERNVTCVLKRIEIDPIGRTMNLTKIVFAVATSLLLFSCQKEEVSAGGGAAMERTGINESLGSPGNKDNRIAIKKGDHEILVNGIYYKTDLISALEFIERKGEKADEKDVAQLKKESVLILDIELNEATTSIFDSEHLTMSRDEAMSYMMHGIIGDIHVEQNKEEHLAHTVLVDKDSGQWSGKGGLRFFLFFNDLDPDKKMQTTYYDRLFGGGAITL